MSDSAFVLDERLARDTVWIADLELSQLRLLNDCRFPWLVLVPRVAGIAELFELDDSDATLLLREIRHVSAELKLACPCHKINVAALGNKVRQLHVHVIARNEGDAAWPGVVWDKGAALPYAQADLEARIAAIRDRI